MLSEPTGDGYLPRYLDYELDELWGQIPALSIDGAKGVGKTESASRRVDQIFHMDNPEVKTLFQAGVHSVLAGADSVLLDEWQHYPPIWDYVRRQVDEKNKQRFLLTGSASPQSGVDTHSGAARIVSLHMRPLALSERVGTKPSIFIRDLFETGSKTEIAGQSDFELRDYAREICASGLPEIAELSPRARRAQLNSYVERIIDRDVLDHGVEVRKAGSLRAWLAAYAAASSTTASYETILNAATSNDNEKPAKSTTYAYRELLSRIWVLDPIPAWISSQTPLKRLTLQVKHHLVDPALAATLLNISEGSLLSGKPGTAELFGQLLESLAALTVRSAGQLSEAKTYHLRTRGGEHEIDLLLERYDGKIIAFEVKMSTAINDKDVRHLLWLKEQIGDRLVDAVVVTTGKYAYRRTDGVAVVPLALLG